MVAVKNVDFGVFFFFFAISFPFSTPIFSIPGNPEDVGRDREAHGGKEDYFCLKYAPSKWRTEVLT